MQAITRGQTTVWPIKIFCIGRNYVDHITELGNEIPSEMVVFSKPNSAISDVLHSTHQNEQLHYEAEICFMVENKRLSAVGFGLDLTKRETQTALKEKGLPWERAKAFDGAALFSNFVPYTEIDEELAIELYINDQLRQQGTTAQMMYKPAVILSELSKFFRFEDGDIIMTGTPAGVGKLKAGDILLGRILSNGQELVSAKWEVLP